MQHCHPLNPNINCLTFFTLDGMDFFHRCCTSVPESEKKTTNQLPVSFRYRALRYGTAVTSPYLGQLVPNSSMCANTTMKPSQKSRRDNSDAANQCTTRATRRSKMGSRRSICAMSLWIRRKNKGFSGSLAPPRE